MRITLVEFAPSAGLFQFALQMGDALAEAGASVQLVTGTDPELRPRSGLELVPILPTWHPGESGQVSNASGRWWRRARRGVRATAHLRAWRTLLRHLRADPPDVVQWANWRFALDGAATAWLARRMPDTVMADVAHTPRPWDFGHGDSLHRAGPIIRRALTAAYESMDVVFVLGEQSRRELRAAHPGVHRVEVIPHGDEGIYASDDIPAAEDTPPNALFFGKWLRYKNLDLLVDAFADVRGAQPEARLSIVGAVGKDVDADALARHAAAVGGVELHAGYVPAAEVPRFFADARVLVAPYRAGNQSGVVHIAQTLGRPVIVSHVGDLADTVDGGACGIAVPVDERDALASAMGRLLADPDEAGRMGRAGRARVERESSWSAVAGRVLPVYEELVAGRRRGAGRWGVAASAPGAGKEFKRSPWDADTQSDIRHAELPGGTPWALAPLAQRARMGATS